MLGEGLSIPATGRTTDLSFHDTLEIQNGRIIRAELDFDVQELKRRLLAGG